MHQSSYGSSARAETAPALEARSTRVWLVALALLASMMLLGLTTGGLQAAQERALASLEGGGAWAPLAIVVSYVVAALLFLPVLPIDLAAGAHFGPVTGGVLVHLAATLAAYVGYLVGRHALTGPARRLLASRPSLERLVSRSVEQDAGRLVLLARLSPGVSFGLLNVLCGAADVPLRRYLAATFVGMLPGTVLFVGSGHLAGSVASEQLELGSPSVLLAAGALLLLGAGAAWLLRRRGRSGREPVRPS